MDAFRLLNAGRPQEALPYAELAVAQQRACIPAHGMLATILLQLGREGEAEQVVVDALELATGNADAYDALAHVSMRLGRHARANDLYRRAAGLDGNSARYQYNLASSERSFGRLAAAESACTRAIELDPQHYPSYLLRSELRVQTPDENHINEINTLLRRDQSDDRAQIFLGYALGKEFDDLNRYDDAFAAFTRAAGARRRNLAYAVAGDEHKMRRLAEAYASRPRDSRILDGHTAGYVFIVGLPRSGTTLLERILSGLPDVRSNGETDNFSRALLSATPEGTGDVFARAASTDPKRVAIKYNELAAREGAVGRVIEKLPMNYLYLGAINRALPDAPLIAVKRSPLDSCFAMFRTLFGEAYPFSYDFEDLARYSAAYEALMQHWRRILGSRLLEVSYEDLVERPAQVGAAVASHCGINWDDSAVDIQRNESVSLTASAAQIRRPIYRTSSGRWRHYRDHLAPLADLLRRNGMLVPSDF